MFANKNKTIIKLAMVLSISLCSSANAYELYQSGYDYSDRDIEGVINYNVNRRLPNNINLADSASLPFTDAAYANDPAFVGVFNLAINNAQIGTPSIAPINTGGHWAALVLKRTAAGGVEAIYNDNAGDPINPILRALLNNLGIADADIKDLQRRQAQDSNGCGAFAVENLIHIANAPDGATADELKAIVSAIHNSANLRINHARVLGLIPTIEECKSDAKLAAPEIESQTKQLINNLTATNGLTHNRMRHLNSVGVASGDEGLKHGVWVKGFIGSATDKANSPKVKSNLHGFVLGADTKINEDITIGAAYNRSSSKSKQKGALTSANRIDSNIFSIYGNGIINDNVSLSANVSLGQATLKTNDAVIARKSKGDLLGSSVVVDYKLYSNESFAIEPRLGASYNSLSLKGHESRRIKIAKIRQHQITLDTGVVLTSFHDINSFTVMPEISADYSYAVWNKGNKVKIISNPLNETVLTQKISNNKGEFKLGAGLTVASDRVEIGGNYEHIIQGKSRSHIGYAKLKLNF